MQNETMEIPAVSDNLHELVRPKLCECCTCGYRWVQGQDGSHSCVENLEKYKRAFEAAQAFIESHVADPDITDEMCEKYSNYEIAVEHLPPNATDETRGEKLN